MKYRVSEVADWVIITGSGNAQNNEPLRVTYLFRRWLSQTEYASSFDLKDLAQFGVGEVGLLASFKREVNQRSGVLRVCNLDPNLKGYVQNNRFPSQFEIYADLESANDCHCALKSRMGQKLQYADTADVSDMPARSLDP